MVHDADEGGARAQRGALNPMYMDAVPPRVRFIRFGIEPHSLPSWHTKHRIFQDLTVHQGDGDCGVAHVCGSFADDGQIHEWGPTPRRTVECGSRSWEYRMLRRSGALVGSALPSARAVPPPSVQRTG
jgi:hypothetical protein